MANDLATVGVGNTRIIVNTDKETAIVDLRNELAATRVGTPTATEFVDSRVGDSSSNGRIERAIRDVKGLVRLSRSALQRNLGVPVGLE